MLTAAPQAVAQHQDSGVVAHHHGVLYPLLIGSTAILVTGLADNSIRGAMQHSGPEVERVGVAVSHWSPRVAIGIGVATLGVGMATGSPELTRTGRDALVAMSVAGVLTVAVKTVIGRERPGEPRTDADAFEPFTFETEDNSFPSGHTSQAFALAAVIAGHTHNRFLKVWAYGCAGAVGVARIAADRHFASDVVAGAIVGTIVGHRVVSFFGRHDSHLGMMPFVARGQFGLVLERAF
jgi:membrane-associated phospholipid phosphatase